MGYYDEVDKVEQYTKMCKDYDGAPLYGVLRRHLVQGSSLLELGCGPGFDIQALQHEYCITGSDLSLAFLSACQQRFPEVPFQQLHAVTIATESQFDCIYSNKVLHHLTISELEVSLQRQQQVLSEQGYIAHSFWLGDRTEEMYGLSFLYHDKGTLLALIERYFKVLESYEYGEFEGADSLFVVAQKR